MRITEIWQNNKKWTNAIGMPVDLMQSCTNLQFVKKKNKATSVIHSKAEHSEIFL